MRDAPVGCYWPAPYSAGVARTLGAVSTAILAAGVLDACLDIGSVDSPKGASGGSGGSGGDAQADTSWPDVAGGESGASDASDASDSAEGWEASDAADVQEVTDVDADAVDAGTSYAAEVLKDKPELYWRLDESAGPDALDSSGNGHHGKYLGAPGTITYQVAGAVKGNGAVELQGGYLSAGDLFDFPSKSPFAFEVWVRPKGAQDQYARLASKEQYPDGGGGRTGWNVWYDDSPNLKLERWRDGVTDSLSYKNALSATELTHVVAAYDGAQMHLYVNGTEVGTKSSSLELFDTWKPLNFGAFDENASLLKGALDEIAIYAFALPAERVSAHYALATAK